MHPLQQLRDDALAQIASAADERVLESVRVRFLGRSGSVSEWSDKMKSLPKEEKPTVGKLLNEVRIAITAAIEERLESFRAEKESAENHDRDDQRQRIRPARSWTDFCGPRRIGDEGSVDCPCVPRSSVPVAAYE